MAGNSKLDLYMLAYHAGVTMQVLAEMAATPLLHSKGTVNDSTYLLLSSLARDPLGKANISD